MRVNPSRPTSGPCRKACAGPHSAPERGGTIMDRRIIAHRGHKVGAPEQTMAAFRLAVELGATMLECDLRFTSDGVAVMMHDGLLDRTTSGRGLVAETDWATIKALDAGSWFDPTFADERVPT